MKFFFQQSFAYKIFVLNLKKILIRKFRVLHVFLKDFEPENFDELISSLKQLATDSSKSRSKKDRKEQR